jgi:hypothetical protein
MYERARDVVMLGSVDTLSPLFLVIGANNTHYCIDLMPSTFAHPNGIGNLTQCSRAHTTLLIAGTLSKLFKNCRPSEVGNPSAVLLTARDRRSPAEL